MSGKRSRGKGQKVIRGYECLKIFLSAEESYGSTEDDNEDPERMNTGTTKRTTFYNGRPTH